MIGHLSEMATNIATAVEQQSVATTEISGNVQIAVAGTAAFSNEIAAVDHPWRAQSNVPDTSPICRADSGPILNTRQDRLICVDTDHYAKWRCNLQRHFSVCLT